MIRKYLLRFSIIICFTLFALPDLSSAFQADRTDTYKTDYIKRDDGSQMIYRAMFFERKVLSPGAEDKAEIILDVFYYQAAGAAETSTRYTLQRIGAPVQEGNYWVIKWKSVITGKTDVMKGKFPKTLVAKLQPQRYLFLQMSKTETVRLDYSNPYEDDEE